MARGSNRQKSNDDILDVDWAAVYRQLHPAVELGEKMQREIEEESAKRAEELRKYRRLQEEAKIRRTAEIQDEVEIEKARRLAEIQSTEKIPWNGTDREFGDWVVEAWKKGRVNAKDPTTALKLMNQHFCKKDGRPFNTHNLYVNLKNSRK